MNKTRKIILRITGAILIILGVISGLVPIIQGWILILAGLAVIVSTLTPEERERLENKKGYGKIIKKTNSIYDRMRKK